VFFDIHIGHFLNKVLARLTDHDDVIKHCSEGLGSSSDLVIFTGI